MTGKCDGNHAENWKQTGEAKENREKTLINSHERKRGFGVLGYCRIRANVEILSATKNPYHE